MAITKYTHPRMTFDGSAAFIKNVEFDSSVYLKGVTHITTATSGTDDYALVVSTNGSIIQINSRQLGTMAWQSDSSVSSFFNQLDSSIIRIDARLDACLGSGVDYGSTGQIAYTGDSSLFNYSNNLTYDSTSEIFTIGGGAIFDASVVMRGIPNTATSYIIYYDQDTSTLSWGNVPAGDVTKAYVDGSLAFRDTSLNNLGIKDGHIDTSLNAIWVELDNDDTSLNNIWYNLNDVSSRQGNYVLKAGDTMTGDLVVTGVSITNDLSVGNDVVITNDLTVGGDLFIDGSLFVRSIETIDVSSAFVFLNTGATTSPPATMQSGIIIDRGDVSLSYAIIYDESNQSLRIGFANLESGSVSDASTQSVATREDTPTADGIAVWNSTQKRFDTSTAGSLSAEAGIQVNGASFLSDISIGIEWGGTTGTSNTVARGDHDHNDSYIGSVLMATDQTGHEIVASTDGSIVYMRYIKAGTGATITSADPSSITIAVTGAEGYVSKYSGAFSPGTAPATDSSMIFYQAEHGLAATGPFNVQVWEVQGSAKTLIYTEVQYNSSGDITLLWTSGAITGDCSVFIAG